MFNIALFEPEIAPNTGNIIRLCANTGCRLHLVEPLGFEPDNARLKRAGLDYHDWASVNLHPDFEALLESLGEDRLFTVSTKNPTRYTDVRYCADDVFLFGPETRGLPANIRNHIIPERRLTLPMQPNNRSLNLANSVSIITYEAWRQIGFAGAANNPHAPG